MKYKKIISGEFVSRPNRFIAHVTIQGQTQICHVKNTGRCKELLQPGSMVYLEESDNQNRKTKYDLVAVKKGDMMVNMDSNAPNKVVQEWLNTESCPILEGAENRYIKPECKYGNSRVDFYVEADDRKIFIEVKGVTLEDNGVARFPDAPSQRAIKHVEELAAAVEKGYESYVIFVIQMKGAQYFTPNEDTHPQFGKALREAARKGVHVLAYDCKVTEDSLRLDNPVEVRL
jgi:sugar fermentation stimulation protein A